METALALADEAVLDGIRGVCGEITSYLVRGESLRLDLAALQKKLGIDQVLSVLLTVYRSLLLPAFGGEPGRTPVLPRTTCPDPAKVKAINKNSACPAERDWRII